MEQEAARKLTKSDIAFLLLFGAFQGSLVALVTTLSNGHRYGHWESQQHLLTRIGICLVVFALGTVALRILFPRGIIRFPRASTGARFQTVAFVVLMLGLAYACWRMFDS
jgi:hypothetical protein